MGNLRDRCLLVLLPILACIFVLMSGCAFPRMALLKDPLTAEEHLNLGVAYEKKGEFDHAIKEYELAANKLPLAYLYLGNVYFQEYEWTKAEEYYKQAIKEDPENADAHNNLAWLYYTKQEDLDEAEEHAKKAIQLNPMKAPIYRDTLDKISRLKTSTR